MKTNIFNIQHFSLYDGPGIRTTVFFSGCPLNCLWCHNPESKTITPKLFYYEKRCVYCGRCKDICPNNAHIFTENKHIIDRTLCTACGKCSDYCNYSALEALGKSMETEDILAEIAKDDIFFGKDGGVTISGGEPFSQTEALIKLIRECKNKDYSVCIETSGYTNGENIRKAAPYTDWFLYDCKETSSENHIKYTGKDNKLITDNLFILDELSSDAALRCPVIPYVNDRNDHFEKLAELADIHSCIKYIELMPYHPLGISKSEQIGIKCEFLYDKFIDNEKIKKYADFIKKHTSKEVRISGMS